MFAHAKDKLSIFLGIVCFLISLTLSQNIFFELSVLTKVLLFISTLVVYAIAVYADRLDDRVIFGTIAAGIITGSLILNFTWNNVLRDYQKARIEAYINPQRDTQNEGFQQEQSKISIGAGQVFGQGFTQAGDSRILLLPEPTTDFIFAIYSFKFGFVGALVLVLIYLVLIARIFYLADHMNDRFSSLVLIGVGTMILVQFFSNVGMNLDILPVGGTTLPFISAGGSSLISMMIAIAFCQNIIATNKLDKNVYRNKDNVTIDGWNM
jgi:rod shape determining protein RodA